MSWTEKDLPDLTGTTAVVTGAKRGIGFAMADALARAGADIIGVSATIELSGSRVGAAVEAHGRRFTARQVDFADRAAVIALGDELAGLDVDILVNNAGTIERAPAADHPLEWWDRVLEVDLSSAFVLTQAVGRSMIARGRGKIIFTASLLSFQGDINVPGYAAAKSGIAGLTKALANEWTSTGVTVNAIAPGYFETELNAELMSNADFVKYVTDRTPLRRWGKPEELAGAALFLASPAGSYVNGHLLTVDGGMTTTM